MRDWDTVVLPLLRENPECVSLFEVGMQGCDEIARCAVACGWGKGTTAPGGTFVARHF